MNCGSTKEKILKIMKEITQSPIGELFLSAFIPRGITNERYHQLIIQQIDFNIIINKLQSNKYQTVKEWMSDVQILFRNYDNLANESKNGYLNLSIQYLKEKFENLCKKHIYLSYGEWIFQISEIIEKMNNITVSGPECIKNVLPIYNFPPTSSRKDMTSFGNFAKTLTSTSDIQELSAIFESYGYKTSINGDISLDLYGLPTSISACLLNFMDRKKSDQQGPCALKARMYQKNQM